MKLIYCKRCGDIFNLTKEEKICSCGKSGGKYVDNLNAIVWGKCQPIGFSNKSFYDAKVIQEHLDNEDKDYLRGVPFEAFTIPKVASSVKYIKFPMDKKKEGN